MGRDLLRVLKSATAVEICSDAGCSECVATNGGFDRRSFRSATDHSPGVGLCHRIKGKGTTSFAGRERSERIVTMCCVASRLREGMGAIPFPEPQPNDCGVNRSREGGSHGQEVTLGGEGRAR